MCNRLAYAETEAEISANWIDVIAGMSKIGRLTVYSHLGWNVQPSQRDYYPAFNDTIVEAIQRGEAYAASDASVKNGRMARVWIIKNLEEEELLKHNIYHKDWSENTVVGAEAITLLALIETVCKKGRGIETGKITIGVDNRGVF